MNYARSMSGTAAAVLLLGAVSVVGCKQKPPAEPARQPQALEVIQRTQATPEQVQNASIYMRHSEVILIAAGQPPLSATEEKRFAHHVRTKHQDGSLVLTGEVHGHFEYLAPNLAWYQHRHEGEGEHVTLSFDDGESAYYFSTDMAESIIRRPAKSSEKGKGVPALRWLTQTLSKDAEKATAIRLLGRELSRGVLCEVVTLSVPLDETDAGGAAGDKPKGNKQVTYYIGVGDNLIRRYTETQGPAQRRVYSELLLYFDTKFVPKDISYQRFETEIKKLLKDKPLPPVVVKME